LDFLMFNDWKRLKKAEEQIAEHERKLKALDMEFSALYDKVRTMIAKWAKRIERAQNEMEEAEGGAGEGVDAAAPCSDGLTPKQRQINAEIQARRRRGPNGLLPG